MVGLLLAVLVVVGLWFAAVAVRGRPGSGERIVGRVVAVGLRETEEGSFPRAVVEAGGARGVVDLRRDQLCRAGDAISLRKHKAGFSASGLQPCRPAGSQAP